MTETKMQAPVAVGVLSTYLQAPERVARIRALAAKGIDPERLVKAALLANSGSEALRKCSPDSWLTAIIQASQLGLDFTGTLGNAYLVPFKGKVLLIPGYRGLIDLARRSGVVKRVEARLVYVGDKFKVQYGSAPGIIHEPDTSGAREDKSITHAYSIAWLDGENQQFDVMTRGEIDKIRARSPAFSGNKENPSGPWVTDYAEMARKTVVRRLMKYLPLTVETRDLVTQMDQAEGIPEVTYCEPEPERTTGLVNRLKGKVAPEELTDPEAQQAPGDVFPRQMGEE